MGDLERMLDLYGPLWIMMMAWIGLAGAVAIAAGRRDFNQYIWFLGCLVLSPLVGFVLLALLSPGRGGPRRPA
jgi:hypothetical protein